MVNSYQVLLLFSPHKELKIGKGVVDMVIFSLTWEKENWKELHLHHWCVFCKVNGRIIAFYENIMSSAIIKREPSVINSKCFPVSDKIKLALSFIGFMTYVNYFLRLMTYTNFSDLHLVCLSRKQDSPEQGKSFQSLTEQFWWDSAGTWHEPIMNISCLYLG